MFIEERIQELEARIKTLEKMFEIPPEYLPKNEIARIQSIVAKGFRISLDEMVSKERPEFIAIPRMAAMHICREVTNKSLARIGKEFGGRDHGTVLHAIKAIKNRIDTDKRFAEKVNQLLKECRDNNPQN